MTWWASSAIQARLDTHKQPGIKRTARHQEDSQPDIRSRFIIQARLDTHKEPGIKRTARHQEACRHLSRLDSQVSGMQAKSQDADMQHPGCHPRGVPFPAHGPVPRDLLWLDKGALTRERA